MRTMLEQGLIGTFIKEGSAFMIKTLGEVPLTKEDFNDQECKEYFKSLDQLS